MLEENKQYTYKQICEILNLQKKTGNAKKKQLRELSKYYDYKKNGSKFYINKILTNKQFLEEVIKRNNTCENIEHILMTILSVGEDKTYYTSNKELLLVCYAINNNYYSILNDKFHNSYSVKKHFGFDESFILYVEETYDILKPMLKTALKSMESKKEISVNKGYKICSKDKIIDCVSETDDLGKKLFKIQGDVMTELGIKNEQELFGKKIYLQNKYYELCNKKAKDIDDSIDKFYQCYVIVTNVDKIKYDLLQEKEELNQKIYNKVHSTKVLRNLSYNQIDKWFNVLHTKQGEKDYEIVDFIKMINVKGDK